ncbi:hypothetical protein SH449x_004719 [Pirellulaceae bacterium SH449]
MSKTYGSNYLEGRTAGITEHEELAQRKSTRTTECFACMPLLSEI